MTARPAAPPRATIPVPMVDDEVLEEVARNRERTIRGRALLLAPPGALVLLGLVLTVLLGPALLLLVLAGLGGVAFGVDRIRHADRRALALLGATPAAEETFPRLHNLVDGLCASTGIPRPDLYVVNDAAPDACTVAVDPRAPSLVVTSGAVESLSVVELEGLVAQQLAHIRVHDPVVGALAVVLPPLRSQLPDLREWQADRGAIAITRYPPGLAGALEKVLAGRSAAGVHPPALAHLWTGPAAVSSAALEVRIDALREL